MSESPSTRMIRTACRVNELLSRTRLHRPALSTAGATLSFSCSWFYNICVMGNESNFYNAFDFPPHTQSTVFWGDNALLLASIVGCLLPGPLAGIRNLSAPITIAICSCHPTCSIVYCPGSYTFLSALGVGAGRGDAGTLCSRPLES